MTDTKDYGAEPFVVDIEKDTLDNTNFRTTRWTGHNLQLTLMTIPVGGDIGLEVHEGNDQFLRLEQGRGRVQMGQSKDNLDYDKEVGDDWAVFVPAGMWHNITNIGEEPLKLYAIYGPPDHRHGTVHATQEDSENDPHEH
ncbi:cupin domain-containing protein [Thalassorhabdomicrobium marinisediminis]|uniref:Cupin domain-containing protein n=1 Tax=Thalassorhabdomicrobium marinisediminis TaxID=2170577 RepID=A0A2T7FVM9_9RHOB|nr:cupin domain-containing protein [Thalassorhabdomicrobium marinisediminis]PVA06221.1 cupin domain-containing protein [Thalassorhabdomicrobium marinisediminis]